MQLTLLVLWLVTGKGLIELLGLPYDEGAQMTVGDGGLVGALLAWIARILVLGAAAGSIFAITKLDENADNA